MHCSKQGASAKSKMRGDCELKFVVIVGTSGCNSRQKEIRWYTGRRVSHCSEKATHFRPEPSSK